MIVKELIEELKKLDMNSKVYLQIDPEGNGYNKLYGVDGECVYDNYTMYSLNWSEDDACLDELEWNHIKKMDKVVVLYP